MSDHYDRYNGMDKLGTNLAEVGTDLISKKRAINALSTITMYKGSIPFDTAVMRIEQLPPAEPKTGRWILDRSGAYCCSECMEPCATYVMMKPRDKFCKMCGSRNEVTECIERPKSLGFDRRPEWPFGGDET